MTALLRRLASISAVAIVGIALAACGGGDDDDDGGSTGASNTGSTGAATGSSDNGSSDNGSSGDTWEGEFETGTDVSLVLWVDPATEPDLADFEAFREASGANPVLYARATATNDGNAQDTSRFATLTGEDGDKFAEDVVTVDFLCSHIGRWIAAVATQTTELTNQYATLLADRCNGVTYAGPVIAPGETVTYYIAVEAEPEPQFERIFMGVGNELER